MVVVCVKFGQWIAANKSSYLSGWYHSPSTIGPDPKPICIGSTLHPLAVTHEQLQFYKLYAHTYGGGGGVASDVTCSM